MFLCYCSQPWLVSADVRKPFSDIANSAEENCSNPFAHLHPPAITNLPLIYPSDLPVGSVYLYLPQPVKMCPVYLLPSTFLLSMPLLISLYHDRSVRIHSSVFLSASLSALIDRSIYQSNYQNIDLSGYVLMPGPTNLAIDLSLHLSI